MSHPFFSPPHSPEWSSTPDCGQRQSWSHFRVRRCLYMPQSRGGIRTIVGIPPKRLGRWSNRRGWDMNRVDVAVAVALVVSTLGCIACIRYVMKSRRKGGEGVDTVPMRSSSSVHILRSCDELRDAVSRAARTERGIADSMRARADRYEALVVSAPVADIQSERRLTAAPRVEQSQLA